MMNVCLLNEIKGYLCYLLGIFFIRLFIFLFYNNWWFIELVGYM